jgi:hypothetical protein
LGAAQPTQDGDPQVMSNSLDYLLALSVGKVKNPSQLPRSEQQAKSAVKHNHQVPLDAITQSNALGCSPISPNNESNKQGE